MCDKSLRQCKNGFGKVLEIRNYWTLKLLEKSAANAVILCVLSLSVVNLQGISMSTVDTITYGKSNWQVEEGLSNRIRDYTAKIFNITTITYDVAKNDRRLFLTNVFPSSFIFYADESSSNLIRRDEILQRHFMFTKPRHTYVSLNQTKHQAKIEKSTPSPSINVELLQSDEDYFLEYDDSSATKIEKNITSKTTTKTTQTTSSCSFCQQHEKAKKESLESIKKHILMRLQLSQPPNITMPPPVVPQKILDYFYKNFNYLKSASTSTSSIIKHNLNKNIPKRQPKATPLNDNDKLHDEEDNASTILNEYYDDDSDIMVGDNAFDYIDDNEHYSTPSIQSDEFYSRLHSIYVFPTKSRLYRNRKPEIFNFKYNSDPTRISSAILHVYIKGQNWLYEYQPDLIDKKSMEVSIKKKQEIMIIIYRALRRPNTMNYTHTLKLVESRQKIPPGKGQWVEIEIKELSTYWMKTPNSTQSIVISGMESWMRTFIVTEDQSKDKSLTMHIEIVTKVNKRHKRDAALDCRESDNEVRCCRYPLKVNFTNFGWNFIVAPQHFDAYFCNGECNVGYLEKYTHTHITSLSTSAKPCCSPQKLSPLALLYFDNNNKLMYSTIPNMSVDKCSCS